MSNRTEFLANLMRVTLIVLIIFTVILILTLPFFVNYYSKTLYRSKLIYAQIILYLTYAPVGVCAILIETRLRKMFISVCAGNSFIMENIRHLKTMGKIMIVVSAIFLLKTFLLTTLSSIAFFIGSVLLSIFCFVLGDIFHQAVTYKTDNDLTI